MENEETKIEKASEVAVSDNSKPGKGLGITSFVLGLLNTLWCPIGMVMINLFSSMKAYELSIFSTWAFVLWPVVGLILGILGIVFASMSRKQGYTSGLRTTGFVLNLIMLIFAALGILIMLIAIAFVGALYGEIIRRVMEIFGGIIIAMI